MQPPEEALGDVALVAIHQVSAAEDGALDQDLEEFMPDGPQRARLDWNDLGKFAPDVDDPRATPMPPEGALQFSIVADPIPWTGRAGYPCDSSRRCCRRPAAHPEGRELRRRFPARPYAL